MTAAPDPSRHDLADGLLVVKAHGTGNDFVVVHDRDDALLAAGTFGDAFVRAVCTRNTGLGADGMIRLGDPAAAGQAGADVFMDYRNADGSVVEMCGNGVRVVADQWLRHVDPDATRVLVATRAGTREVTVALDDGGTRQFTVDMGEPRTSPDDVPFVSRLRGVPVVGESFPIPGGQVELSAVSMGNPHAVVAVRDVRDAPVDTLGPWIERHERFPEGANVGFVHVVDEHTVDLRVWERGVGETAACGTGACAAVVAMQQLGEVGNEVAVRLPGGVLQVSHIDGDTVRMTGPATQVLVGTMSADWLAQLPR